jgi:hypothetical protein
MLDLENATSLLEDIDAKLISQSINSASIYDKLRATSIYF